MSRGLHLRAAGISPVANDNPPVVRQGGRFDPEPIDPEALALIERVGVDEDDVRRIAFPALLDIAESVPPVGVGARLRPPVAIDDGKTGGAVQAQIAEIVSLAIDRKPERFAGDFPAAAVETDQGKVRLGLLANNGSNQGHRGLILGSGQAHDHRVVWRAGQSQRP